MQTIPISLGKDSTIALGEIQKQIQALYIKKGEMPKVIFVSGSFNIVHPGHLRLLRFARECGSFLVVGILDNSASRVLLDEKLRHDGINSISWVDYSFILRDPPAHFIYHLQPAIVVKGKEYEEKYNPEEDVVNGYKGKLLFSSGDVQFSSVDLLRKNFEHLNLFTIHKPRDFPLRHGFKIDQLHTILEKFQKLRVGIIGDSIVDEYITCTPVGMSQEDPTIVVNPLFSQRYMGGAAIIAAHAAGLGGETHLLSICGQDNAGNFLKRSLKNHNIKALLLEDASRSTTLKQRFRAGSKTLLRVNYFKSHEISQEYQEQVLANIDNIIDTLDMLVYADFSYGCLPQSLVDEITQKCIAKKVMMAADSQSSSQVGDISRFQFMDLVTPTEHEVRLAMRDKNSGLVVLAEALYKKTLAKNIILTLNAEGGVIHAHQDQNTWLTDRLPAFNSNPQDPAGAGDSFHITTAMALCVGASIWQSAYLGSLAAACQVARVGNIPLNTVDMIGELQT